MFTTDRPSWRIGKRGAGQVFLMRLFPCFMNQRLVFWCLVPRPVQPAVPIRIDARRLNLSVKDHPAFAVISIAVINIALGILAHFGAFAPSKQLRVQRLAGVKIGKVTDVALNADTYRAETVVAINDGIEIPDDSALVVSSEGLLGGNYMEIVPGGSPLYFSDGDVISDTQGAVSLISLLLKFVSG